ncbi:iron-sulfur cluster scaffold-like protein [Mycoplasmopsis anatis]|uniref:Nitrogen fixation protein nifu n=1 Tax=Mycoplasmopsis anatis 1340 TaxID=1034808 RepID=F9QCZ8_9BACT|nr:iron-sulfur cluster scaffold-like protein [Mycoplasmopsis anatis]EGS29380.1 nitrogen fixation protein nifu [Mycoplasmopsis anatis 1340]VEU73859.1 nitrogen fixation protein NIFU [Mycoplasmopsis anatis]
MDFNQNQAREIIMNNYVNNPKDNLSTNHKRVYSTSCADLLEIDLDFTDKINKISTASNGCAIFVASTNILKKKLINKEIQQAKKLIERFIKFVHQEIELNDEEIQELGDLWAFYNVKTHLNRIDCATLTAKYILDELK